MARRTEVSGEKIAGAVMEIIEESGWSEVSARSVAARLGISTQPIYREFGDMNGVRAAATERGWRIFASYVSGDALNQATRYVMFATEHKRLFEFLFREQRYRYDGLDDLAHKLISDTTIIGKLSEMTGLSVERTYRQHLCVWMALHGLAVMSSDNDMKLTEEEVSEFTKEITSALTLYYKSKGD